MAVAESAADQAQKSGTQRVGPALRRCYAPVSLQMCDRPEPEGYR